MANELYKEIEDFYDSSPDRAIAISLPAIVENHLTSYIHAVMRPDAKILNELFHPSGALGNFGTKIRLAYMLALIPKETYKDLIVIGKIRNEFAHKPSVKSLDQQPIKSWIHGLFIYATLDKIRKGPTAEEKQQGKYPENFLKSLTITIRHQLETTQGAFRECIRLYIHHLANSEKAWRANAAKINSQSVAKPPTSPEKPA